ncbi:MAG: response regulator [bacterium]|nr:response regulator [bacterium]
MKIAILDDNRAYAGVLKEILVFKGHNAKVFFNGLELLKDKFLLQFDMIIIDLYLPDQYGLSIIRELKEKNVTAVMVIASNEFTEMVYKRLREIGIRYMLKKPFVFDDLNRIILSIGKVERLIGDFIEDENTKKRVLLLASGANYKVLHNVKIISKSDLENRSDDFDMNETCLMTEMSLKDLLLNLPKFKEIQARKKLPKIIIPVLEDIATLSSLLEERVEQRDALLSFSYVIDLKYLMS